MYMIQCPYIGRSLKTTYHKDVTIFKAAHVAGSNANHSYYTASDALQLYKGKWKSVKKTCTPYYSNRIYDPGNMVNIPLSDDIFLFASFNHAYTAKCILLERLRAEYLKALVDLQARMERNCPDIKVDPLMFSEHHPEHFI